MKTTEQDLIIETADAIDECLERDGDEIVGFDEIGVKAILTSFVHRLRSGATSVEETVIQKIRDRAQAGQVKYGMTMERDDLKDIEWMTHAQEEMMDGAIYLEKMIQNSAS